jgi:hypothetical protein
MSKLLCLIVSISVLAMAGTASVGAPLALTNAQMDVVTAGGSSSKSYNYSKDLKSTFYHDMKSSDKSKRCNDFTQKEKSKHFDYSKNHDVNSIDKSKTYDDFGKKGSSQLSQIASAASGHMFSLKAK